MDSPPNETSRLDIFTSISLGLLLLNLMIKVMKFEIKLAVGHVGVATKKYLILVCCPIYNMLSLPLSFFFCSFRKKCQLIRQISINDKLKKKKGG